MLLLDSQEWSIQLSLPLPRQHCPTLFSLAQGWSTKASTNPQVLFQDKQALRGRTARV